MNRIPILAVIAVLSGCAAGQYYDPQADEQLTVGAVQKEIRIGMSGAEVAEVLGSPNIVSTDENRNEVWIYDKISTQYVRADASAGILAIGGAPNVGAVAGASGSQESGATSQRTLTVIIKFDGDGSVRDFAYHTSRF
jgi:outer membrane protein assembly factor BamE (lipoprotein component of BamABCDE complex)